MELVITETSSWDGGWCAEGEVINDGEEGVTWSVRAEDVGTITSIWDAEDQVSGDETVFIGVEWNSSLASGERATFGFCAEL